VAKSSTRDSIRSLTSCSNVSPGPGGAEVVVVVLVVVVVVVVVVGDRVVVEGGAVVVGGGGVVGGAVVVVRFGAADVAGWRLVGGTVVDGAMVVASIEAPEHAPASNDRAVMNSAVVRTIRRSICERRLEALPGRLERVDRVPVLERQPDVVQAVHQAMLVERFDLEAG
jgi:hypothetical protein